MHCPVLPAGSNGALRPYVGVLVGILNLWLTGEKARTNFDCLMFRPLEQQCIHDLLAVAEISAFDTGGVCLGGQCLSIPSTSP